MDDNCDGQVNESCGCTPVDVYADEDQDTFGDPDSVLTVCEDEVPQGYVDNGSDCDDDDGERYPGAAGSNDCNAVISVTNADQLHAALASATAGATIQLAAVTYTGRFAVTVSGQEGQPITITGPVTGTAVLVGSGGGYRGALEIHHQEYIVVKDLEITNPNGDLGVYLTGENGDSTQGDGCAHITLRRLHVHDTGDEGIKIRNLNTHDILIEENRVHDTTGSGIDVQGNYPDRFPDPAQRPRRIIIRDNLIWDAGFAGIANEIGDQLHIYNNIVLGSDMGLDIGCGNNIVIKNNLITSDDHYAALLAGTAATTIDLDQLPHHPTLPVSGRDCKDGIAVSGTYMTLIYDNEITDCNDDGDLIISYDHHINGEQHNTAGGHRYNLFFRNRIHHNNAYKTVEEFDKQTNVGAQSLDQVYFNNLFADNQSQNGIVFEHSVRLLFANNTIVNGDQIEISESSDNARVKNNIFYNTENVAISDSTGSNISNNVVTTDAIFVDPAAGDYHLNSATATGCIDHGENINALLAAVFDLFDAAYNTSLYNWHADFTHDIVFDYYKDFDGNTNATPWDVGAYAVPR